MGTFTLVPDSFDVISGNFLDHAGPGAFNPFVLSSIFSLSTGIPPPFPRTIQGYTGSVVDTANDLLRLNFSLTGNTISLDGNPIISFTGLPVGFRVTSAVIHISTTNNASDATSHFRVQFDQSVESPDLGGGSQTFAYPGTIPSALLFFLQGCGIHVDNTIIGQRTSRWISQFSISGTYDIVATQWTIQNPAVPVRVGDKVKVSSSVPFAGLTDIILQYTDPKTKLPKTIDINFLTSYYVIFWTFFEFWFYLPLELADFSGLITVSIKGTQFSGSVLLGFLQILFEDASGIYSLVTGQTSDILYFRDGYITDIKIRMLMDITDDDDMSDKNESFFTMLQYPTAILSQSIDGDNDDYAIGDFSFIPILRIPVTPISVEIPSPFARTALLP